jgi:uncharacterized protein YoxC
MTPDQQVEALTKEYNALTEKAAQLAQDSKEYQETRLDLLDVERELARAMEQQGRAARSAREESDREAARTREEAEREARSARENAMQRSRQRLEQERELNAREQEAEAAKKPEPDKLAFAQAQLQEAEAAIEVGRRTNLPEVELRGREDRLRWQAEIDTLREKLADAEAAAKKREADRREMGASLVERLEDSRATTPAQRLALSQKRSTAITAALDKEKDSDKKLVLAEKLGAELGTQKDLKDELTKPAEWSEDLSGLGASMAGKWSSGNPRKFLGTGFTRLEDQAGAAAADAAKSPEVVAIEKLEQTLRELLPGVGLQE